MMKNLTIILYMKQFIKTDISHAINQVESFWIDRHDQKFYQISLHTYDFSDDFVN